MRRSDLLRIDYEGKVLDGGPNKLVNRAAILIHAAFHKARPDVTCAAHTHSIYGHTFATLGISLPITSQDGCAFYSDLAFYGSFEGIVLEGSEGEHIAEAVGPKKAAILQNHGLVTMSDSVEATVFWYISLEKLCQTQLLAMAAAAYTGKKIVEVGEEEVKKYVGPSIASYFTLLTCSLQLVSVTWAAYEWMVQRETAVRLHCRRDEIVLLGLRPVTYTKEL